LRLIKKIDIKHYLQFRNKINVKTYFYIKLNNTWDGWMNRANKCHKYDMVECIEPINLQFIKKQQ